MACFQRFLRNQETWIINVREDHHISSNIISIKWLYDYFEITTQVAQGYLTPYKALKEILMNIPRDDLLFIIEAREKSLGSLSDNVTIIISYPPNNSEHIGCRNIKTIFLTNYADYAQAIELQSFEYYLKTVNFEVEFIIQRRSTKLR